MKKYLCLLLLFSTSCFAKLAEQPNLEDLYSIIGEEAPFDAANEIEREEIEEVFAEVLEDFLSQNGNIQDGDVVVVSIFI